MEEGELEVVRRAYAKQVLAAAGVADPRIEAAFAAVKREDFLGPGPWPILRRGRGHVTTPGADPVYLYTDDVVGILPERDLNNGLPSLHAEMIAAAAPQAGEHVVHVGAGLGYYTAILARLSGRVTTIEFDPALAARAAANLAPLPRVRVVAGDATRIAFDPADVIYVNAGATRPPDPWLDRLRQGGRMILPLTTDRGQGAAFCFGRDGSEFRARWLSMVGFIACAGARDGESERALAAAFERGGAERVQRLTRRADLPEEECWLRAPGWCLTYR